MGVICRGVRSRQNAGTALPKTTDTNTPLPSLLRQGFCFVDFAAPESATMALQTMNGFQLAGRPIKVGRPTTGQGSGGNPMMKVSPGCASWCMHRRVANRWATP